MPSTNPSSAPSKEQSDAPSRAPSAVPSSSPSCVDEVGWKHIDGLFGFTCAQIATLSTLPGGSVESACATTLKAPYKGKANYEACCVCGGNDSRLVAPSEIPSGSPSELPSLSLSPSSDPTRSPSGIPSDAPSGIPSAAPSGIPSDVPSGIPSDVPSGNPSETPSLSPSSSPSESPSQCFNEPDWRFYESETGNEYQCETVKALQVVMTDFCDFIDNIYYDGKNAKEACCVCNGGVHVTVKPSTIPSSNPS
jgi:hypothetical protein